MISEAYRKRIKKGIYWQLPLTLVEGCTAKSPACKNCWLSNEYSRFFKDKDFSSIMLRSDRLEVPLKKKSQCVFAVWSDLFHEKVPDWYIIDALKMMIENDRHAYYVLTKRPERISKLDLLFAEKSNNIYLGTTAENQEMADLRIPELLKSKMQFKMLSVEPMLGPVSIEKYAKSLKLVICGSESGAGYRETKIEWVRALRDECVAHNVMFFLKQLRVGKFLIKAPILDGRQWLQLPGLLMM
ncbi:MAG: DUF5131 family protein [Nitrospirae bacterium]|nr:DUF5131 family protein [Nitrospirota bacterium]